LPKLAQLRGIEEKYGVKDIEERNGRQSLKLCALGFIKNFLRG